MGHIHNRAAEYGSMILETAASAVTFTEGEAIAIRVLETAEITTLTFWDVTDKDGNDTSYYDGKTLTTSDPTILGTIKSLTIASGAVQIIYGEG
jgi:hypothetical protein